ncbi:MAG: hypothetical protein HY875_17860 [Chloroflexi bacterium]|nr:hypothetical protein [Chloroflexota bacterium]
MTTSELERLIREAYLDPELKARLVWFPDAVLGRYGLSADECQLVKDRNVNAMGLRGELLDQARELFDLSGP